MTVIGDGSEVTITEQRQSKDQRQVKPPTDWWAVANTGLLTLFTGALAWLAHRQHKSMERQGNQMKRQTRALTKTFYATHRPKLVVRFVELTHGVGTLNFRGDLILVNTGETSAKLTRSYSEIVVASALPQNPDYLSKPGDATPKVLTPGEFGKVSFPSSGTKELAFSEFADIGNRRELVERTGHEPEWAKGIGNVYLFGWVEYSDEAERVRRFGFCRRYDYLTKRFEREPNPDYEYED